MLMGGRVNVECPGIKEPSLQVAKCMHALHLTKKVSAVVNCGIESIVGVVAALTVSSVCLVTESS